MPHAEHSQSSLTTRDSLLSVTSFWNVEKECSRRHRRIDAPHVEREEIAESSQRLCAVCDREGEHRTASRRPKRSSSKRTARRRSGATLIRAAPWSAPYLNAAILEWRRPPPALAENITPGTTGRMLAA